MGRIDSYDSVSYPYNPNDDDLFLIETENGTKTISSNVVMASYAYPKAQTYTKTQINAIVTNLLSALESKQDSSGAFKYVVDDANHTGIDNPSFDTIYLAKIGSSSSDYAKVFAVKAPDTNLIVEYGFYAKNGLVVYRISTNGTTWNTWEPIGISANIKDGAVNTDKLADGSVTFDKISPEVLGQGEIDELIIEGEGNTSYTATGTYVTIGDLVIISVKAKCTTKGTYNSFSLPIEASQDSYIDVSTWGSLSSGIKQFSIKATGTTCYIRTKDGSAMGRTEVDFTLAYLL